MRVFRLFNEPAGHAWLVARGVPAERGGAAAAAGHLRGVQPAVGHQDGAPLRDGRRRHAADLLHRLRGPVPLAPRRARRRPHGPYSRAAGRGGLRSATCWAPPPTTWRELRYQDRKRVHNLKYFTWVEQQGRTVEELNALWSPSFWTDLQAQLPEWDRQIEAFNRDVGRPGSEARSGRRRRA